MEMVNGDKIPPNRVICILTWCKCQYSNSVNNLIETNAFECILYTLGIYKTSKRYRMDFCVTSGIATEQTHLNALKHHQIWFYVVPLPFGFNLQFEWEFIAWQTSHHQAKHYLMFFLEYCKRAAHTNTSHNINTRESHIRKLCRLSKLSICLLL